MPNLRTDIQLDKQNKVFRSLKLPAYLSTLNTESITVPSTHLITAIERSYRTSEAQNLPLDIDSAIIGQHKKTALNIANRQKKTE